MTPSDRQQVQQMIQQSIAKSSQAGRFNLQNVQQHEHGGIGSRPAAQPILTYIGIIEADGTVGLLPVGWSVTMNGVGDFTVNHNLPSTALYTVVVSPAYSGGEVSVSIFVQPNFGVVIFDGNGAINAGFNFIMTVINNKSTQPIRYAGILVT